MSTKEVLRLPEFQRYVKMTSGFGGGISGRGFICGAVSGGVMALVLRYGTDARASFPHFVIIESFKRKHLIIKSSLKIYWCLN
jgi:C_GCAxxG_C_C family probable redox protein